MVDNLEKIVSLAKRRGFVFKNSEIYGGVEGVWDFGPLGAILKQNIKNLWIEYFVQKEENIALIDSACLMHPKVWEASGHLEHFTDLLVECKNCHLRYRVDHLKEGKFIGQGKAKEKNQCPNCGQKEWTEPRKFNLMFKTFLGSVEDKAHQTYLRPETAQGMFINFENVLNSTRFKLPFGIAQIGKSFRNEITLGDFIFRLREFEIAEIEYFVKPEEANKYFEIWVKKWEKFLLELGLSKENLRQIEHSKEDLAHYSRRTIDIQYRFPFGWAEIAGIANRGDYDLTRHSQFSQKDLRYFDPLENKKYYPFVIEPTMGIERVILAVLCEAYEEIIGGRTKTTKPTKEVEVLLKLNKKIAPIKVAVLPLVKSNPEIVQKAKEVYKMVKNFFFTLYDEVGSIGRRYRRMDEIGVPYCLTIDSQSLKDNDLTIRDRDTMEQERVKIDKLIEVLKQKLQ